MGPEKSFNEMKLMSVLFLQSLDSEPVNRIVAFMINNNLSCTTGCFCIFWEEYLGYLSFLYLIAQLVG